MKFKTYILTIKYNTKEDKPEFIKEELIVEEDDIVIIEFYDVDDAKNENVYVKRFGYKFIILHFQWSCFI